MKPQSPGAKLHVWAWSSGCFFATGAAGLWANEDRFILPPEVVQGTSNATLSVDVVVLGNEPIKRKLIGPAPEYIARPQGGSAVFLVKNQQVGISLDEPVFVTPATSVSWVWRKEKGHVCVVQFELIEPTTNQRRYFGYGAGTLSEPPAADPTVEVFVSSELPKQGDQVERRLFDDMRQVLGWEQARIASVYLSPGTASRACFLTW